MNKLFKIGTEVTCVVRGRRVKGVIAGDHYLRRKGKTRELAAIVTGDPDSLNRTQHVIVSMTDDVFYRTSSAEATGKKVSATKAVERLRDIKAKIAASKYDRQLKNFVEAEDNDLAYAEIGSTIQMNFRDIGWTDVEFAGFVKSSGNVRYKRHGRTRTMSPKFARAKKQD
jgi:hypothetical protein